MSLKINKHVLVWSIITYLFVFQRALVGSISIFNYMDELFAIIVGMSLVAKTLSKKVRLNKNTFGKAAGKQGVGRTPQHPAVCP